MTEVLRTLWNFAFDRIDDMGAKASFLLQKRNSKKIDQRAEVIKAVMDWRARETPTESGRKTVHGLRLVNALMSNAMRFR